ncbi:hypothetical protein SETIT_2G130600v2 [Setaria italica]|uniref:Copine C-terminal domain-containing protein n=2 Tax=Setaria italica TaxID=4555 RepID=A0A368PY41_SETIT|nr:E3 ubiquitin-protein ligase RGLG1 [Setaria italica]RCV10707.1 hypothetical protein SETIT_2G130600v2 [Setaria italica]
MIFSTLFLLFCFTWSLRLKRVTAESHGSAGTDQNCSTLDQVKEKLQKVGLESSNLVIGVDFTRSNEWTGKHCFNGRSLHHLGNAPNPYEQAIGIIGRTLSAYDEDNKIPCFGFGDTTTHDRNVFNFHRDGRACTGVSEALQRYREIAPHVRLSGPTSLVPIIETATRIVEVSRHQYHILLIIADGQVPMITGAHSARYPDETRSVNILEERTLQALIHASHFPLSIVLVGVGDVPWDDRIHRHDNRRLFDNFQFVDFTEIMSREMSQAEKEDQFALEALRKIPAQYSAIIDKWIREQAASAPPGTPLPPPC